MTDKTDSLVRYLKRVMGQEGSTLTQMVNSLIVANTYHKDIVQRVTTDIETLKSLSGGEIVELFRCTSEEATKVCEILK